MQPNPSAALASGNMSALRANSYPGRGILVGLDETGQFMVQMSWIMGRSTNSRNRIYSKDDKDGRLFTEPADPAKVENPELIIYNAMREHPPFQLYVVSNGAQTDAIMTASGIEALADFDYEPDAPNFTPRITGVCLGRDGNPLYQLSLTRKSLFGDTSDRFFFNYENITPGFGYCLMTYSGDGDPLPAFRGEPQVMILRGGQPQIAEAFWAGA